MAGLYDEPGTVVPQRPSGQHGFVVLVGDQGDVTPGYVNPGLVGLVGTGGYQPCAEATLQASRPPAKNMRQRNMTQTPSG
jgi:hypothetical protein